MVAPPRPADTAPMRGSVRAAITVGVSVAATLAAAVAWGGSAQIGSAAAFRLVFDGHHTEALLHEGTFTSSSPLCSSGQAADASINEQTLSAVRIFTCAEGGTFSARISPLPAEHTGTGTWQVLAGTGPLADLRGKGTFIGTATSGDPHDPRGLTFRSTWTGVVDLDATPPRLGVLGAKVLKLSSPRNTRLLRLTLSVSDAEHNVVSYLLTVDDRRVPAEHACGEKRPDDRRLAGVRASPSPTSGNALPADRGRRGRRRRQPLLAP